MKDIVIIGSGPGGYVAAIRAAQLGKSVAIVERAELGGVCLNWGCIPTKALLKSAHVLHEVRKSAEFGVEISGEVGCDFSKIIARSRSVAATMSKGVQFLLKKNNVEVIEGEGRIAAKGKVEVTNLAGEKSIVECGDIIIATGARARELANIPVDGDKVITYRQALTLESQPESMVVIGSGAIGVELANFYHEIGTKVTIVEYMPNLVPLEDEEVSKYLERSFRKAKLPFLCSTTVTKVETSESGCKVYISNSKGESVIEADKVLSAVGIVANIENLGLEELGVDMERGRIVVDNYFKTSIDGIYAIGDVIATPALAHVASAEAICCVEKIAGLAPEAIDYSLTPSCVYTQIEIASVGMTQKAAEAKGIEVRVGKFPYTASGKATAMGNKDGFVKLIFDAATDKMLGAHLIGTNVTEMLMESVISMKLGATAKDILSTIHPHPTLNEAVMEAAAAAHNEAIHV